MKYVYGPLRSRRLGNSLGVSTVPHKVCSFDCVYCQLKETTQKTRERKIYVRTDEVIDELRTFFANKPPDLKVDYVTFSGAGEPTLHREIGTLIAAARSLTDVPIVVITNASTMIDEDVRRDLLAADILIPSLDAVTQDVFEKIDRPVGGLKIEEVIEGLRAFRREFSGQIWLEIMLVRDINDSVEYLRRMKEVVSGIAPDRVQINAPVRPPASPWVKVPDVATFKKAKAIFGKNCDVVC